MASHFLVTSFYSSSLLCPSLFASTWICLPFSPCVEPPFFAFSLQSCALMSISQLYWPQPLVLATNLHWNISLAICLFLFCIWATQWYWRKTISCCNRSVVYSFIWGAFQSVNFLPTSAYQQFQEVSPVFMLSFSCLLSSWVLETLPPHASEPSYEPVRPWPIHSLALRGRPTPSNSVPTPLQLLMPKLSSQKPHQFQSLPWCGTWALDPLFCVLSSFRFPPSSLICLLWLLFLVYSF